MNRRALLAACLLLAWAQPGRAADDPVQQAVQACEAGLRQASAETAAQQDEAARLAALLAVPPDELEPEPVPNPLKPDPEPAPVPPGPGPEPAAELAPPVRVAAVQEVRSANELLVAARAAQQQVQAKLASVRSAANPAEAQVRLREAEDMVAYARTITRQAGAILRPPRDPSPQPEYRPAQLGLGLRGSAIAQARVALERGEAAQGGDALSAPSVVDWDDKTGEIVMDDGRTVDVRPLAQSFRQVAGPGVPLFTAVPPPPGASGPEWRLSPEAVAATRDPRRLAQMEQAGGVDLRVTLDLLEFNELEDFRKPGPALLVERPVLVSLAALAAGLEANRGRWDALADDLRFPGQIERIVGFVLAPNGADVLLVGVPASTPARRLDAESLIVGLRSVWLEGQIPLVSLDPMPGAPGGPQYTRVSGVPDNSRFARVMLDADYEMKRIMLGAKRVALSGFTSMRDLLAETLTAPASGSARFWFTPGPIGRGDLRVSPTARSFLFNADLRVQSDAQRTAALSGAGAGSADPLGAQLAESFTSALSELERSGAISPPEVFAQLRGLVDIVTLASVLRSAGIDSPVLRRIAVLPTQGAGAVPDHYPGITARVDNGSLPLVISGGVDIKVRASRLSVARFRDRTIEALEEAASLPSGQLAGQLALRLVLPRAGNGPLGPDRTLAQAQAAITVGDFAAARPMLQELTELDPLNSAVQASLAQVEAELGNPQQARAAIERAVQLDPLDKDLRVLELALKLQADPGLSLANFDRGTREALAGVYILKTFSALAAGDESAALRLASAAVSLDADNPDAHYVRGLALGTDTADAIADFREAVELHRRRLRSGDRADEAGFPRVNAELLQTMALQASIQNDFPRLAEIVAQVVEERLAYPENFELHATQVVVLLFLSTALPDGAGLEIYGPLLLEESEALAQSHPDNPLAYSTLAEVYMLIGRFELAGVVLDRAIALDPTFAQAYSQRAEAYASFGACERARADAAQALRLRAAGRRADAPSLRGCE